MFEAVAGLFGTLFSIGGKMIEDKDKRNEYAFKVLEMANTLAMKMLEVKTYPWIDGLVKLAYAADAIIMKLLRPLGAAALTGVVIYCDIAGIELSGTIEAIGMSAFPGWMTSRHINKQKQLDKKKYAIQMDDDYNQ